MIRKVIITMIVCIFVVGIGVSALHAQNDKSKATDEITAFQNSREWGKLGPRIKEVWGNAMKSGNTDLKLECFVRVRYPPDQGDESFLISNGFIVQVFAGSIARGHMKASALPDVARQWFVDSIKLSTKTK